MTEEFHPRATTDLTRAEPHDEAGGRAPVDEARPHGARPQGSGESLTGNSVVDDVIATLDDLAEDPVDAHVAVFEHAHEQLRGVLDGPRTPRP